MGTSIVSTSHGVMTGHEARAAGVGGEVLAQVWYGSRSSDVQNRKTANPRAERRDRRDRAGVGERQRAQRRAFGAHHRDIRSSRTASSCSSSRPTDRGEHRALHGLTRTLVANMVQGVTDGYEKRLEIQGVGYRAQLKGKDLELAVGYSHPVPIPAPAGIEFEVPQPTRIVVKGISKQLVGETAAIIRKQRPPEPYKGKGIRYEGEYVARKVGKRAIDDRHDQGATAGSSGAAGCARRSPAPPTRPRISVFRSNRGLSAQLVDDIAGRTLAAVSLVRARAAHAAKTERAARAGALLAERAKAAGVDRRRLRPRRLPLPRPRQGASPRRSREAG